ncbi:MAG: right-handed parallel beta-helix repeat-containing protein, partial [Armatimonadetes bacterium]|nr:right-handed parallel beta-helix repeat-containing protein [Armatimonadota bacterium]
MRKAEAIVVACWLLVGMSVHASRSDDMSKPLGDPILDPPTLHCLGVYWIIAGDDNKNSRIEVAYRNSGTREWRQGSPLFRVEKGGNKNEKGESSLSVPGGAWLFAGSLVLLAPNTVYELKLNLVDPDGGKAEKLLKASTIAEPIAPRGMRECHVVPGGGGGAGTLADPYRGLLSAQANAQPGDLFLLHAGIYEGTFTVTQSGEPGKPILWRGAGDGETILDGQGAAEKRPGRAVSAVDIHDVWFEGLTICNADYGIVGHRSSRLVVRRCHLCNVDYGLTCTNNDNGVVTGFFISDNLIEGPCTWPRTKGIENPRGIQVTGAGHVVCYNRIRGFADAIDTFPSPRCFAIDFHNNDLSEMTDDGIEMDYSERNTRCFFNRVTNVFQGISVQPVYGGPVYVFRNALYNVVQETFKMHNSPSGALMLHNTSVKKGLPLVLWTSEKVRNCLYRNNLFLGTVANYAYETTAPMVDCDFDFDGFGGGPWENFLKWNGLRYKTPEEVRSKSPVYRHVVLVDPASAFAVGLQPPEEETKQFAVSVNDLHLKAGSAAIDAGEI